MSLYFDKQFEIRKILKNIMSNNTDEEVVKIIDDEEPEVYEESNEEVEDKEEDNKEYDNLNKFVESYKDFEE